MKANKQVQAIEKAMAIIEKENDKMAKGYRQGKSAWCTNLSDALCYLNKAKELLENYNFESLKY